MSLPKPYYQDSAVTIYHGDQSEILPSLTVDLLLTDPPYGMNWGKQSRNGFSGGKGGHRIYDRSVIGDDQPFDPAPFVNYPSVILWGYHHFAQLLPVGSALVWVKKSLYKLGEFLSDAEIAWEKNGHGVYVFHHVWDGCARETENQEHYHPTQKPVALMAWCMRRHPEARSTVDPFMGSGTTLRAAKDLGRKAIGIEIEEKYCEIAARRMEQEVLAFDVPQISSHQPELVEEGFQATKQLPSP